MRNKAEKRTPEKTDLRLGFIPLTDCCTLVIAKEKGFFEKYGLNVALTKEVSWANIRDKVSVGALDGAHMLAGIPIATTLGLGFSKKPMVTAFSMDLNGNAITISNELYERMATLDEVAAKSPFYSAVVLKRVIEANRKNGKKPLTFAMVYPFSNHNYEIRYWMASAGIDPDHDVRLRVIPPQCMVENLRAGQIDGFCVGEPWNAYAVKEKVGIILITGYEIWNNSPEKVFGVTGEWADKYPYTHIALIKALLESARWIDKPENRPAVTEIISDSRYVNAPAEVIKMSMTGTFQYASDTAPVSLPDFNVFHRYLANFPWRSHAAWIITQMYRWGQLNEFINIREVAGKVYQPDIYREAAAQLSLPSPCNDYKTEGVHPGPWQLDENKFQFEMGSDRFFDGMNFNPDQLIDYITGFKIKHRDIDFKQLAKINKDQSTFNLKTG
ncbi:MAG: ABC transporter substrate-binding protein [Gammaproteobacteria bacterium]|nr:ABC transporter substrate-binding protein [Gammaproteobacteria bacterium]